MILLVVGITSITLALIIGIIYAANVIKSNMVGVILALGFGGLFMIIASNKFSSDKEKKKLLEKHDISDKHNINKK